MIFTTDKTGTFTADTPSNYKEACEVHTNEDENITEKEHQQAQKDINAHATIWTRITNAGSNNKSKTATDRIKANLLTENSDYAPLYTLRKDHKPCEDSIKGPKTRPVCGGSSAYNSKFAHFISMIIRPLWQDEETVCTNTEEVMAKFNEINKKEIKSELLVGSADVKALYPSLDIEHASQIVAETFYKSEYTIEEVNTRELSLYLSLNMSPKELEEANIAQYCHTRKNKVGAPPKLSGSGIDNNIDNRYKSWIEPEEEPDENTEKKMISIALKVAIKFIMKNHIYKVNNQIKRQKKGGAIGLELTGDIAQIYMVWWDIQMKKKLYENNIVLLIYIRYVDDINMIIDKQKEATQNRDEKEDLAIMEKVREIGNSIHPSIEITTDTPAQNPDKKQPILDLKVWPEVRKGKDGSNTTKILHEFYHKEIGSKAVTNSKSALDMQAKRNILTAEMLRVLLRCSPLLDWSTTAAHASEMNKRIQNAGYNHQFRRQITEAAINKYKDIKAKDKTGECPIYRDKSWKKKEREKKKQNNKTNWYKKGKKYKSVLFVPATPGSKLQKEYKKVINKHKINIKVVEKAGTKVKNILQKSDPFKSHTCTDTDCFTCKGHNNNTKPSNCRKEGIIYKIQCNKCPSQYIGESSRNAISRGREHLNDYKYKREHSVMLRHTKTCHPDDINNPPDFKMTVTQIYKNRPLDRQISEAIQISNLTDENRINNKQEYVCHKLAATTLIWE